MHVVLIRRVRNVHQGPLGTIHLDSTGLTGYSGSRYSLATPFNALKYLKQSPTQQFRARLIHSRPSVLPVVETTQSYDRISVEEFRDRAVVTATPLCMRAVNDGLQRQSLPAITKWFRPVEGDVMQPSRMNTTDYLDKFFTTPLPYELLIPHGDSPEGQMLSKFVEGLQSIISENTEGIGWALDHDVLSQISSDLNSDIRGPAQERRFARFNAPLLVLTLALHVNNVAESNPNDRPSWQRPLGNLYIAQAPINDLPQELQNDLPVGDIVKSSGRGDIYGSSIWLGLEPTNTPLHRDPNPNLFVQLCGAKVVRLLSPENGDRVFHRVQQQLGRSSGNSRIRGAEMMEGLEREAFYRAVWESKEDHPGSLLPIQEAILEPGDALYIPKGWWHSVKSTLSDGRLNGSVNWWFR